MPNITAGYGRLSDLIAYFWEVSYTITCLKPYNFIKLLQIVYLGRSADMKSKPL